eukprot:9473679-Pyramimonas_sp.AAC.2
MLERNDIPKERLRMQYNVKNRSLLVGAVNSPRPACVVEWAGRDYWAAQEAACDASRGCWLDP